MPSKGYVTIALPKIIVEQVEEVIKDKKYGYISRPEFIKEAISVHKKEIDDLVNNIIKMSEILLQDSLFRGNQFEL